MEYLRKLIAKISGNPIARNLVLAFCAIIVFGFVANLLLNLFTRHGQIRGIGIIHGRHILIPAGLGVGVWVRGDSRSDMILFTVGVVIGAGIHGIVLLSTTITIIIITIVLTMVGTDRIVLSTLPTAALLTAMAVVRYLPGTLLHRAGGVRLSAQGLREIRPVVVRLEM